MAFLSIREWLLGNRQEGLKACIPSFPVVVLVDLLALGPDTKRISATVLRKTAVPFI